MRISDMVESLVLSGAEFVPVFDPNQQNLSQQNRKVNVELLQGLQGERGFPGLSAYQLWLNVGNTGTVNDFVNSISGTNGTNGVNGTNGESAYQTWLDVGNTGTPQDFINSLKGLSAYQVWLAAGNVGSSADFIASLRGPNGYSAYELWEQQGHSGTVTDFINSLQGLSAYQVWLAAGNVGSQNDFLASLKGQDGSGGPQGVQGPAGPPGSVGTIWYEGTGAPAANLGAVNDYYLNTSNGDLYNKTNSGWGSPVINLKGPQGPQGIQGPAGAAGAPGSSSSVPIATNTTNGISRLGTVSDIANATAGAVVVTVSDLASVLASLAPSFATAWVNFSGVPATPSIKASFNISGVAKVQTGVYDLTFATPMDNAFYVWSGSAGGGYNSTSNSGQQAGQNNFLTGNSQGPSPSPGSVKTTSTLRVYCRESNQIDSFEDTDDISVTIFGGKNNGTVPIPGFAVGVSPSNTLNNSAETNGGAQSITSTINYSPSGGSGPYSVSITQTSGGNQFSVARSPTTDPFTGVLTYTFTSSGAAAMAQTFSAAYTATFTDSAGHAITEAINITHNYTNTATGGGGTGGGGCVAMASYLSPTMQARDVEANDTVKGMDEDTREFYEMSVNRVRTPEFQPCIRVTTKAGPSLIFSLSTPLTLEDSAIMADSLTVGTRLPVQVGENTAPFWDPVTEIEDMGMMEVQLINVKGKTKTGHCFAAGEKPGMYIYTHNEPTVKN